jgi:hypothetical protein
MIDESALREPGSYQTVASVRVSRAELADRGIRLSAPADDGSWDEAGPIEEALIELDTGEQPLVIWHLAFESERGTDARSGLELRAPISTPDPGAFAAAFVREVGLAEDRCEWVIPLDDWRGLQAYAEGWRAYRSGEASAPPPWPS